MNLYNIPLFEYVRAGLPFTPQNNDSSRKIDINNYLIEHPSSTYFVRIKWDSMIDAWIQEGDIAIVDKFKNVKNWDIIIASIEWNVTIKFYKKEGHKVILMPANKNYNNIIINSYSEILWVVVWIIRKYS